EDQVAHAHDRRLFHDDATAVLADGLRDLVHVRHADRALEADHALAGQQLAPALQSAAHGLWAGAREDLEEPGRTPGLDLPAEHALVEPAGPRHVVGVDREVLQVVRHLAPPPWSRILAGPGAGCPALDCHSMSKKRQAGGD